jgi:hypothetical protein
MNSSYRSILYDESVIETFYEVTIIIGFCASGMQATHFKNRICALELKQSNNIFL